MFVIRKAASIRKHSCGSRGRRGAASASTVIAATAATRNTADSRFSAPSCGLPSTGRLKCSRRYQIEPQSA